MAFYRCMGGGRSGSNKLNFNDSSDSFGVISVGMATEENDLVFGAGAIVPYDDELYAVSSFRYWKNSSVSVYGVAKLNSQGTWQLLLNRNSNFGEYTYAVVYNGEIYFFYSYSSSSTVAFYKYSISNNTITQLTSIPSGVVTSYSSAPKMLVLSDGLIHIFSSQQTTHVAYNPSTNSWATKATMPSNMKDTAVVEDNSGLVHFLGGQSSSSYGSTTHRIYNVSSDTWTTGVALPVSMAHSLAYIKDGKIRVAGTYTSADQLTMASQQVLELDGTTWGVVTDEAVGVHVRSYSQYIYYKNNWLMYFRSNQATLRYPLIHYVFGNDSSFIKQ